MAEDTAVKPEGTGEQTPPASETPEVKAFDARTDLDKMDEPTRRYVEKLRAENAQRRTEAQQARALVDKLEQEKKRAVEDKLKEQGEYKKLYEDKDREASTKIEKLQSTMKMQAVQIALQSAGAQDPDFAKMVDLGSVSIGEDGEVRGVREAVDSMKANKPHLFTAAAPAPAAAAAAAPAPASTSAAGGAPGSGSGSGSEPKNVVNMSKADYLKQLSALKNDLRRR